MPSVKTIIIGGGIAGLACARKLYDEGLDFLLITDRLGGRICPSEDFQINFGAKYVADDYQYVLKYVARRERFHFKDAYFWDKNRFINLSHIRNFRYRGQIKKLRSILKEFHQQLIAFRHEAPYLDQVFLLDKYPLLKQYLECPVIDFVKKHKLEELNKKFFNILLYSTIFQSGEQANAFYYLMALLPLVNKTYVADFRHTIDRLCCGYKEQIILEPVLRVEKDQELFIVRTQDQVYQTPHLVIAAPPGQARMFYPDIDKLLPSGLKEIPISSLLIKGARKKKYCPGKHIYLSPAHCITGLFPEPGGFDLVHSKEPKPDLHLYYHDYEIVKAVHWKTAVVLTGQNWCQVNPEKNLYLVGDYNIFTLEDSYLTGLFVANHINVQYK